MAIIAASFRVEKDESEADYQKRYKAITDKIKSYASGTVWEETTSFYLFESSSAATTIASGVYLLDEFRATKEILLVINTSSKTDQAHKGAKNTTVLNSLLGKR
jgi:hypothetical protein